MEIGKWEEGRSQGASLSLPSSSILGVFGDSGCIFSDSIFCHGLALLGSPGFWVLITPLLPQIPGGIGSFLLLLSPQSLPHLPLGF